METTRITLTCGGCSAATATLDLTPILSNAPAAARALLTGERLSSVLNVRCPTCEAKHGT